MLAEKYVTIKEAAEITGFSYYSVYRRARLGRIEGVQKYGRGYAIPLSWTIDTKKKKTVKQIAEELGISRQAYYKRLKRAESLSSSVVAEAV